jgi:hypothetical protein
MKEEETVFDQSISQAISAIAHLRLREARRAPTWKLEKFKLST